NGKTALVTLPLSSAMEGGDPAGALTHLYEDGASSVNLDVEVSEYKDNDNIYGDTHNSSLTLERDSEKPKAVCTTSNEIVANALQIELNRGQQGVDYTQATVADQ